MVRTVTREEAERDNHTTPNALMFIFTPKGAVWSAEAREDEEALPRALGYFGVWRNRAR